MGAGELGRGRLGLSSANAGSDGIPSSDTRAGAWRHAAGAPPARGCEEGGCKRGCAGILIRDVCRSGPGRDSREQALGDTR